MLFPGTKGNMAIGLRENVINTKQKLGLGAAKTAEDFE